ncbi:MAG: DinB family protein [Candidatus Promineifilaceae bacterium]
MEPTPPAFELLAALESFALVVSALLDDPAINWHWQPDEESWSLTEVMCHLRDVEREVHLPRYEAVLAREQPFLSGVDSDNWAASRAYHAQDGRAAALTFLALRAQSLDLLRDLSWEQWQRTANHAFFGNTSLQELTNLAVQHDEAHEHQIQELMVAAG